VGPKIRLARIPYRVPEATELPGRLRAVPAVLYLIYNASAEPDAPTAAGDLRTEALVCEGDLHTVHPSRTQSVNLCQTVGHGVRECPRPSCTLGTRDAR
jgi:RNA polymerase sigma-70 factor (ECF subfamily)